MWQCVFRWSRLETVAQSEEASRWATEWNKCQSQHSRRFFLPHFFSLFTVHFFLFFLFFAFLISFSSKDILFILKLAHAPSLNDSFFYTSIVAIFLSKPDSNIVVHYLAVRTPLLFYSFINNNNFFSFFLTWLFHSRAHAPPVRLPLIYIYISLDSHALARPSAAAQSYSHLIKLMICKKVPFNSSVVWVCTANEYSRGGRRCEVETNKWHLSYIFFS